MDAKNSHGMAISIGQRAQTPLEAIPNRRAEDILALGEVVDEARVTPLALASLPLHIAVDGRCGFCVWH